MAITTNNATINGAQFIDVGRVYGDVYAINNNYAKVEGSSEEERRKQLDKSQTANFESLYRQGLLACTEGTRTGILTRVYQWIDAPIQSPDAKFMGLNKSVLWLNGPAGTGKTTLAWSIAEHCQSKGILGACFFAAWNKDGRNDPRLIIPAIAQQLHRYSASFKEMVSGWENPEKDGQLLLSGPFFQLERYIQRPLQKTSKFKPCIVIIDALDECKGPGQYFPPGDVLASLARAELSCISPSQLRFVITSRRDEDFVDAVKSSDHNERFFSLALDDEEPESVHADIHHFILKNLRDFGKKSELSGGLEQWPTDEQIHRLAEAANGLFVYAATCVNFIRADSGDRPGEKLKQLLSLIEEKDLYEEKDMSALQGLHSLYDQILCRARLNSKWQSLEVLGAVVLIRSQLSPQALDNFLGLELGTTRAVLTQMNSVVSVPEKGTSGVVEVLHPSFAEFMVDSRRGSQQGSVVIDRAEHHTFLARRCWEVLKKLKPGFNMGVTDPTEVFNSAPELKRMSEDPKLEHIMYAVQHWSVHFCHCLRRLDEVPTEILDEVLQLFKSRQILVWIETCARMGALRSALWSVVSIRRALEPWHSKGTVPQSKDLYSRLRATERWIRRFYKIIEETPSQVYILAFSPRLVEGRRPLIQELFPQQRESPWDSREGSMQVKDIVRAVATFMDRSGNERIIASSDAKLEIWDMLTGVEVQVLEGHGCVIWSIAVSQDHKLVVSGSSDETVKVWDLGSGVCKRTLEGHDGTVRAVALSPSGRLVVSGGFDCKVRVWDVESGNEEFVMEEHERSVKTVSFSADGRYILSGSEDGILYIWELNEMLGETPVIWRPAAGLEDRYDVLAIKRFELHKPIITAMFSPHHEKTFACATSDGIVRFWGHGNWEREPAIFREYEGHSVAALAFSPLGTPPRLGFVAEKNGCHVQVYAQTDNNSVVCNLFHRHSSPESGTKALAFSRDGSSIVVPGSGSNTISVWRLEQPVVDLAAEAKKCVTAVVFSPDKQRLVTGSRDGLVSVWDLSGLAPQTVQLESHWMVQSAAFSPDGKHLAIGDGTGDPMAERNCFGSVYLIRLGSHIEHVLLRTAIVPVDCLSFSPCGNYLAQPSGLREIVVWDLGTVVDVQSTLDSTKAKKVVTLTNNIFSRRTPNFKSILFSSDGSKLLTVCGDCRVILWDAKTGDMKGCHYFERHLVGGATFTPDGRGIIAATSSRAIGLFDTEIEDDEASKTVRRGRAHDLTVVQLIGSGDGVIKSHANELHNKWGEFADILARMQHLVDRKQIGLGTDTMPWSDGDVQRLVEYVANGSDHLSNVNAPSLVRSGNWLCCLERQRRIMAVSEAIKNAQMSQAGNIVAFGTDTGGIHVLDITRMVVYLDKIDKRKSS